MAFNVRLEVSSVPYLERDVIEEFSSLKFYSQDNQVVSINPLMLVALDSKVISNIDDESSVMTEFSLQELENLKEFICTGSCEMALISDVLNSLGIDFQSFSERKLFVKPVKLEEVLEVKEEASDDFKENEPDEPFDLDHGDDDSDFDFEPVIPKGKKSTADKKPAKRAAKEPKASSPKKKKWQVSADTEEKILDIRDIPSDFELPKPIEHYRKSAAKPLAKRNTGKDLKCEGCKTKFSNRDKFDFHNFKYHEDYLKCPYCHKRVPVNDEASFTLHVYNHWKSADICVQCGKVFSKSGEYNRHLKVAGPYHDEQCAQCPEKFKTHQDYRAHVKYEHLEGWFHKCGFCKQNFKKSKDLKFHVSCEHKGTRKKTAPKDKNEREICDLCGKSFLNLKSHMLQVHEKIDQQVPCPHCDAKLRTIYVLKRHIEWFHVKDPCPDCGKLIGRAKMRRHKLIWHETERKFKCDVCSKSFITNQALRDHKNIHTGEKPYKCKFCNAAFASGGTHAMHQKGHLGHKRSSK